MEVLFEVPAPYSCFSDDQFLLMGSHVQALRREGIPFEDITERPVDHD
jgi:hypothetical protein